LVTYRDRRKFHEAPKDDFEPYSSITGSPPEEITVAYADKGGTTLRSEACLPDDETTVAAPEGVQPTSKAGRSTIQDKRVAIQVNPLVLDL